METERRLSQAVWDVVATQGIEGTSVRAVAERAGCTTGLIMHRFGSRAALLVHARRLMLERTTARADAIEAEPASPAERLRRVLASALPLDTERVDEARVWLGFAAAAVADPALREIQQDGNRTWLRRLTRLILATGEAVDEAPAEEAAVGLAALVEGLGSLAVLDPHTYTGERLERALDDAVQAATWRVNGGKA